MFPNSTEWMLFLSPVHLPGVCFADANPIGKTINIEIDYPLTVQGVLRIFRKIPNFILTEFIPSIPDLSNMVLNVVAGI